MVHLGAGVGGGAARVLGAEGPAPSDCQQHPRADAEFSTSQPEAVILPAILNPHPRGVSP